MWFYYAHKDENIITCIGLTLLLRMKIPQVRKYLRSIRIQYSCASLTPPFLRIYSTLLFLRILDNSISTYLLDSKILAHPFLRIYSTVIFLRILDTSISMYLLDSNILAHPFLRIYLTVIFLRILNTSISTYLLDSSIVAHSSTTPFLRIYSTVLFLRIPGHLHFYVSTRQ